VPLVAARARRRILNGNAEDEKEDVDRRHAGVGQPILLSAPTRTKAERRIHIAPARNLSRIACYDARTWLARRFPIRSRF
jgi:hypothetical protein